MVASIALLDILLAPRTLLGRLRNPLLARHFLCLLELAVRSVLVLAARLALVCDVVLDTVFALARYAPELGYVGRLHLARLAIFGHAPPEIGYRIEGGAHAEIVVPEDLLEN